jgi:hypothetical protein
MATLAAQEALSIAFEDEATHAFFPAEWGDSDGLDGAAPDDPLTVYWSVALGAGDFEDPIWQTSLGDMLQQTIEDCAEDGSFAAGLSRIRDALRELADRIDGALPSNVRANLPP